MSVLNPGKRNTFPKMAYFAGTGPAETSCGSCRRFDRRGAPTGQGRCDAYQAMTGQRASPLSGAMPACKYWEGTDGQ